MKDFILEQGSSDMLDNWRKTNFSNLEMNGIT